MVKDALIEEPTGEPAFVTSGSATLINLGLTSDDTVTKCDGLFVATNSVCNNQLLGSLGVNMTDEGWPVVDETGCSSVPQVWIAGNAAKPKANLIVSAASGFEAAATVNVSLLDLAGRNRVNRRIQSSRRPSAVRAHRCTAALSRRC